MGATLLVVAGIFTPALFKEVKEGDEMNSIDLQGGI